MTDATTTSCFGYWGRASLGRLLASRLGCSIETERPDSPLGFVFEGSAVRRIGSATEVAAACEVTITAFTEEGAAEAALAPKGDLIVAARAGHRILDLSLMLPATLARLRLGLSREDVVLHGCALQLRGEPGSDLAILADRDTVRDLAAMQVLGRVASAIEVTGETGTPKASALIEAMLVTFIRAANAEALDIGDRAGMAASDLVGLLLGGSGANAKLRQSEPSCDDELWPLAAASQLGEELARVAQHPVVFAGVANTLARRYAAQRVARSHALAWSRPQ